MAFERVTSVPAQPHGRAGRDLRAAVGIGLLLAGLVLGSLLVVKAAFVGVVVVAMIVAVHELAAALAVRGVRVPLIPVLLGTVAIVAGSYAGGAEVLVVAMALTLLAVLVWRLGDGSAGFVRDTTAGVFTALYIPFLAGFAILLLRADDGAARVLTFFIVAIASDVGGYAVGVLAGRHPMAPTVSPKKSWEGFAGSVALCAAAGVGTVVLLLRGPWWGGALLGLACVVSATLGDLAESMLKRDLGVKDMGRLLPGHGGIMDRLDSLLPSAPVAWRVLRLVVPA